MKKKTTRRRLHPEERKVELLNAAITVLNTVGPVDARVEDITREAGAAKGTFYLYFSSWEEMLIAVREHILTRYVAGFRERFRCETAEEWWQYFELECAEFLDFQLKQALLHEAVFHGVIANHTVESSFSAVTVVRCMLEKGVKTGACRNHIDVEFSASLMFTIIHAMCDKIANSGDRARYFNATMDLLQSWLCPSNIKKKLHAPGRENKQ